MLNILTCTTDVSVCNVIELEGHSTLVFTDSTSSLVGFERTWVLKLPDVHI